MAECKSLYVTREGNYLHCQGGDHTDGQHSFAVTWDDEHQYVPPPPPPTVNEQFERLKFKFPDAERVYAEKKPGKYAAFTLKFTMKLPKGYNKEEATIAFDVPPSFPCSAPSNFFIDKDVRYSSGGWLGRSNKYFHSLIGEMIIVYGHVYSWNPNHDTLYTYAMVIKRGLEAMLMPPVGAFDEYD